MAKGYQKMTETETEAETLERLETALRRIGDLARQPRAAAGPVPGPGQPPEIDRVALLHSLDLLISRLRNGLELPPAPSDKADINGVIE